MGFVHRPPGLVQGVLFISCHRYTAPTQSKNAALVKYSCNFSKSIYKSLFVLLYVNICEGALECPIRHRISPYSLWQRSVV